MLIFVRVVALTFLMALIADPAWAYVGPGAGLGLLAAFWALLTATLAAIGFLIFWPLRRVMRRATGAPEHRRTAADRGQTGNPEPTWRENDRHTR